MEKIDGVSTIFHYALEGTPNKAVVAMYAFDTRGAAWVPTTEDELAAYVASRIGDQPVLHRRIMRTPLGLDNPVWADDPQAGIRDRVSSRQVGGAGTWQDLVAKLMEIASEPDAGAVPLEVILLRGVAAEPELPPGATVVALRIDHAAMDGMARVALERRLFPAAPEDWQEPAPSCAAAGTPSKAAMLVSAVGSLPLRIRTAAGLFVQARKAYVARPPAAHQAAAPPAITNTTEYRERVFVGLTVPMAQLRAARSTSPGATVNDVALTAVAGGLRAYLLEFGELPDVPLLCNIPVALPGGEGRLHGNNITRTTVPLWTTLTDLSERLRAVHDSVVAAKEQVAVGYQVLVERAMTTLSAPLSVKILELVGPKIDPVNTAVANVSRGPQPLFLGGARAVRTHLVSLLHHGAPLTHQVTNLEDTLMVSVVGEASSLRHPERYRELLAAAFAELAGLSADGAAL